MQILAVRKVDDKMKLVVFDLDGTLLNSKEEITCGTIEAISKLKACGYKITIATGRPEIMIRSYVDILSIDLPVISCNGAVVANQITGENLIRNILSKEIVSEIFEYCSSNNHDVLAYTDFGIISKQNKRIDFLKKKNEKLDLRHRINLIISENPVEMASKYDVFKLLIIERDEKRYQKLQMEINKHSDLEVVQSNHTFLDVMVKGSSKKEGIVALAKYLNIKRENIIAFGDHYNDVEMLKYAGLSIGMGNGVEDVKRAVSYVTESNDDEGVSRAINSVILKEK